jgi:hypothetical protein
MKLREIIEPGLITDHRSYWAMHFCAIFETLLEHKGLEFTFFKSIPDDAIMSAANLLSYAGPGFFRQIKRFVSNWGLQYFMSHYLRSFEGRHVVLKLLEMVSDIHGVDLLKDLESYGIHVCGADSYSGTAFLTNLEQIGALVLGYSYKTIGNINRDINYVDLCILIHKKAGAGPITAVLGEVEGNHGERITREFFNRKSSVCSFGLGVKRDYDRLTIHNVWTESGVKTVLMMGSNFNVIADFHTAIDIVEVLFDKGSLVNLGPFPGFKDAIDLIKFYWHKPVYELMVELRRAVKVHSEAQVDTNPLTISPALIPKLIIGG